MKAVVAAFNQEKALVGAFSVIVKTDCGTDGSFYSTNQDQQLPGLAAGHPGDAVTTLQPHYLCCAIIHSTYYILQ